MQSDAKRIEPTAQRLMQRHERLEPHDPADECFVALAPDEGCNQHVLKDAISMQSACNQHAISMQSACKALVALSLDVERVTVCILLVAHEEQREAQVFLGLLV